MKIALFGATGTIGRRILDEALSRGHDVTAVVRDPKKLNVKHARLKATRGNVLELKSVAEVAKGHDAVVSAFGPGSGDPRQVVEAAHALIEGAPKAGVRRLLVVGGAGSLEVAPGVQIVDTPEFPAQWKGIALAHREALAVYRKANLDWTCLSPAAIIEPGKRTGRFRTGTDQLLTDARGESRISAEDFAVALMDELEKPKNVRRRMTVAY